MLKEKIIRRLKKESMKDKNVTRKKCGANGKSSYFANRKRQTNRSK